ncbi:hypothetical protein DEU32_11433 [Curtobacterium sp. AG1037]|uniref:hypothetical protein n=1 Tax=Curtobacterium sp. AG1037 TaxID=2183990 RepID=UPI000E0A7113|nr:hypothetical protein [Curtobacterium sp. AG1037]RDH95068.1 hypothetical protein DEU32_11433 [Curtobacterium sp. AG1037]
MPREISLEEIEQRAQQALQDRMSAMRDLMDKRQSVIDARALLEDAERQAASSYADAVGAGWTDADLRDYGLGDLAGSGSKPRRKSTTRKTRATRLAEGTSGTPTESSEDAAES